MFRNDSQISACCRALLARVELADLWAGERPSERAYKLRHRNPFGSGAKVMLRIAWDLWNGAGKANVGDAIATLDNGNLRAVGTLLAAIASGPHGVDEWLLAQAEELETRRGRLAVRPAGAIDA